MYAALVLCAFASDGPDAARNFSVLGNTPQPYPSISPKINKKISGTGRAQARVSRITVTKGSEMAKVLILGGGFGGVVAAERLAEQLGDEHQSAIQSKPQKAQETQNSFFIFVLVPFCGSCCVMFCESSPL